MFSFKYHFSCKIKHLSSVEQYPQSNPYSDLPSSITLWYLENIMELHNFLWVLRQLLFLTDSNFPRFWVVVNREHRYVNRVCTMVQQLLIIFFMYEFVPDRVISSLFGYILTMLILIVLLGPFRSTNFDDELILHRSSSSYRFTLNIKLDYEFVSYPWFQ